MSEKDGRSSTTFPAGKGTASKLDGEAFTGATGGHRLSNSTDTTTMKSARNGTLTIATNLLEGHELATEPLILHYFPNYLI